MTGSHTGAKYKVWGSDWDHLRHLQRSGVTRTLTICHFPGDEWHSRLKSREVRPDRIRWDGGPIMRTRLILAEGANHAQIDPPSTHSRCVHLECDEVEVGPRRHFGSAAPACQQTKVVMHQSARWRCPRLPQAARRWCASCRRDIAVAADGQALVAMIRPRRPET